MVLNLVSNEGSVGIDGNTVTVKKNGSGETVVLAAASVTATAIRVGLLENEFSVYYRPGIARFAGSPQDAGPSPAECCLTVAFRAGAKELWDALSSMIMEAARNANATAGRPLPEQVRDAVPGRAA